MNILVVCHYGLYQDLSWSFVHQQVKAYVALGHQVRVVVPIAVGKRDWSGSRFSATPVIPEADGAALCELRYLSLSKYGEGGFNTRSATAALRARFPQILEGFAPDVIHAHTLGLDSELGGWLKKKLGCPLVVTTHGSDTFVPNKEGNTAFIREKANIADHLICVSSLLERVVKASGAYVETSVILNGFNVEYAFSQKKQPLSIIQVGSLIERKKVDITIRAFATLHTSYPTATLTLVGQGEERAALEALCRELGVSQSVRFTGQLPNAQVLSEMAKMQFFVMPSVREGFGIVYLEAMACGCVTIGTEGEGVADLIVSGQNGILVPPDDPEAITRAVQDCQKHPEKVAALAENGRQSAVGLTWEKNATQVLALMQRMIENGTLYTK